MKYNIHATISRCLALLLASAGIALGQTSTNEVSVDEALQAEYQRILSRCGLKIMDRMPRPVPTMQVTPISYRDMDGDVLLTFFTAIDVFPASFVQRTRVKYVVFCKKIMINGVEPSPGIVTGDTFYLTTENFGDISMYAALYLVVDPQRNNTMWTRLNNPRFTYVETPGITKSQLDRNKNEGFLRDFISAYGMQNERYDRADTFAIMLADPKQFSKLAEENTVIAKKGEMMKQIAERVTLDTNKEFWDFVAENDEGSRRHTLIERAITNAKLRQENKPPILGGFQRTKK